MEGKGQTLKKVGPNGGSKVAPPLHCMPVKELLSEHKRIVGELKTVPSLKKEYQTQKKELAKYKKIAGGEISAPNLKSFVEAAYNVSVNHRTRFF